MAVNEKQTNRVRVLVADDNTAVRDTVIQILGDEFEVVGAVADGRALVDAEDKLRPDIGIIDISMPLMNGLIAAAEIRKRGSDMKIVFLTVNEDCDFVRAAFEAGALAYVVKRQMATDLIIALKEAMSGRKFVSAGFDLGEFV